MNIRRAAKKDIPGVLNLLSQVLEVHAGIRPDIFVPGTTKYDSDELSEMFRDDTRPVYVACDGDTIIGYAFCQIKETDASTMVARKTVFIDDLCVDEAARGRHVASDLFEFVRSWAKSIGCGDITLNVWEGNDAAISFYRAMGMSVREMQMELFI